MGPGIIIPVVVIVIVVPTVLVWARRTFRPGTRSGCDGPDPSTRLTSSAIRAIEGPWRIVYEIAPDKLGGIEHVLIGPGGIFGIQTSMAPMPAPEDPDPHAIGRVTIVQGHVDDPLRRCAMASDSLVRVHWGVSAEPAPRDVAVLPGLIAVDGRRLKAWADAVPARLTPAQIDLAWQTVATAIGRPDPLG